MTNPTLSEEKLLDGERYSTGHEFLEVASGATVNIIIRNPANSGKAILLDPIRIGTTALFSVQKYRNRTTSADGTALNIVNKNFDSARTSVAEAYHTNTLNADGDAFNSEIIGTSRGVGGDSNIGADYLAPGNTLVIVATNRAGANQNISFDCNFIEINYPN